MQKRTLVQPCRRGRSAARRGRSSKEMRSGRSSSEERRGRSSKEALTLGSEKWTLVHFQLPESFTPGREKWGARACDFTSGAHGGREERVGTSPPLPLGLLLLPSSMFVSFRVLHGNGEPDSSC
ncbi:hypothetical protein LR48_Vigan09g197700 [Vigna angularis]|uniref:Uncharacterized protein n=1 Tax=Phaseolus angularis TaxID=3914 RepID=A0A0L9VE85_PHAAN|nr:hypothetical protein LR48_Vigan09g197700 [Vigna angularis]